MGAYTATIPTCEMLLETFWSTAKMLVPEVPWRFAHALYRKVSIYYPFVLRMLEVQEQVAPFSRLFTLFYWKSHSPFGIQIASVEIDF